MTEPQDWHLIDRYLAGEASADEIAAVETRRLQDPAWARTIELLRAEFSPRPKPAPEADIAWARLKNRIDATRGRELRLDNERPVATTHRTRLHTPWLRVAAGIVIAVGSIATWRLVSTRRNATAAIAPNAESAFANDIRTPNGTRQTITLGDGSQVTLNAGSRLRWSDSGHGPRDVYLDGEAYFSVTHDPARPFRVHARDALAHDLGTRFIVRAYPELPHVEVVVTEGSVSLRHDRAASSDSAVITAGQLGRLGESGPPTIESNVPLDRWTGWTGGSLVLDGLTLADAIPRLDRWYDVAIAVPDSALAARRISSRFHDETLPQVLDAITLALGARWQQSGRTVTILRGTR
jgi:transmembrane sensor